MGVSLIAGAILVLFAFVWPYYNAVQEARSMIEAKELAIVKKQKFVEKTTGTRKQLEARKEDLDKVESLLSSGRHTEDVIVNIESIAREAGVTINDFKTGVAKGGSGEEFALMQVELITSGQYATIFNLVRLLEKNLRIFDIQEFNISKKDGGSFAAPLFVTFKMNTYYLK